MWTFAKKQGDRVQLRYLVLDGGKVVDERVQYAPANAELTINGQLVDLSRCQ